MKPSDAFRTAWEFVQELTPEERRAILDFEFPDAMFRWDDDKAYWDNSGPAMMVRGEMLDHAEARYLRLLVLESLEFMTDDLPPSLSED